MTPPDDPDGESARPKSILWPLTVLLAVCALALAWFAWFAPVD